MGFSQFDSINQNNFLDLNNYRPTTGMLTTKYNDDIAQTMFSESPMGFKSSLNANAFK